MTNFTVKIQTGATKFETVEVMAENQKQAWAIAAKMGVVVGIK